MTDRMKMKYVSCPVCGRILLKCQGDCTVEITCGKCNREIMALVDEERIMVLEKRNEHDKIGGGGQVKVSMPKGYFEKRNTASIKRAASY